MKWSSDAMYEGRLEAAERVASHTLSDLKGVNGEADVVKDVLLLIDTAGCGMEELTGQDSISRCNEGEAGLVVTHVQRLVEAGLSIEDIAVVTPYNLQVELLRLNLRPLYPDLEIKSVDGFQGREKEAVLLSLVRSNPRKEVGFLGESRRLNVAVTRARRQVTVVCDTETVRGDPFLAAFIDYMETEGEVQSANQYQELPNLQRLEGLQEIKAGSTGIKGASSESKGEVKKKSKDNENTSKNKIKVPR